MSYIRPIPVTDVAFAHQAKLLAGGWCRFSHVEVIERGRPSHILPVEELSEAQLAPFVSPRPLFAGISLEVPRIMGILNLTPDSFSDGGQLQSPEMAVMAARSMAVDADILDIGGESTRPGAHEVDVQEEITRTKPIIADICAAGITKPISVDTRKAAVARAAFDAGATLVNDVSALGFDPDMADVVAGVHAPIILMHSVGIPKTMQDNPHYDDVVLDVYDALAARISVAEAAGIERRHIAVDPGIGFGKALEDNLALLSRLSLFHGLGLPVLLGASRKGFIGNISGEKQAQKRMPGSLAVALSAVTQGVQMIRVHDVSETRQALSLWLAMMNGKA